MAATALIFAEIPWLWVLAVFAAGMLALWFIRERLRRKRLAFFVFASRSAESLGSVHRAGQIARFVVGSAALGLLLVALARPLTGPRPGHAERKGVDFVIILDVSKSMWVNDVEPSRLAAVKKDLMEWFKTLAGDRVGLVLFAGDAFVQAPITFDYRALSTVLAQAGPKSISLGGTNIPRALEIAANLFKKTDVDTKAVVIVSDGDNLEGDATAAARDAFTKEKISVFVVGVGTPQGGKVPSVDPAQNPKQKAYVRNEYGLEAVSRVDELSLRGLATAGGGRYYAFKPEGKTFQALRTEALQSLARKSRAANVHDYFELFQIPLGVAIVLLLCFPLIPTARKAAAARGTGVVAAEKPSTYSSGAPIRRMSGAARSAVALLGFLAMAASAVQATQPAPTPPPEEEAERLLSKGKAADAVAFMAAEVEKNKNDGILLYNYGLTLYRAGQFEQAIEVFQSVKNNFEDPDLRYKATLQLGSAQFRLADNLRKKRMMEGASVSLERSLAFFQEAYSLKSTAVADNNRQASADTLENVLYTIGDGALAEAAKLSESGNLPAEETRLRSALQVFERAAELNPKNAQTQQRVEDTRRRLVENLAKAARKLAEAAVTAPNPEAALAKRGEAVTKYDAALAVKPNDSILEAEKKEVQKQMSAQLTDQAEKEMAPSMQQEKLDKKAQQPLVHAKEQLTQAQALDPENKKAKELNEAITKKLEDTFVKQGQEDMAAAAPMPDPEAKLNKTAAAAENFQKALAQNAESAPAKEGLQQAQEQIPGLHAEVGKKALEQAKAMAAASKPQGSAQQPPQPPNQALQQMIGTLEKAAQNFDKAVTLAPDNAEFRKDAETARSLLAENRDKLDAQMRSAAQEEAQAQENNAQDGAVGEVNQDKIQPLTALQGHGSPKMNDAAKRKKIRDW